MGPMDPFSEGINMAGPSNPTSVPGQIETPPIPTPALPLSSYTRGQVEEFPIDLDDRQDSLMQTRKAQEGTLNDSRHAPASTVGPVDKEKTDDEEMLDEEEEKIPREPFQRIWEGQQVLAAIEGRIKCIDSGKMTRGEKRQITKTVVALLDALEVGLCKDRGAVIVDVDDWYTDYIWGEEDENHDYKRAEDILRDARALQTQTLKDKINMMSGRLKGVEQDLRIIKTKLGAAIPEETQAVEKYLKKKEEE